MSLNITLQPATANDATDVAIMVGELLAEIMDKIGERVFNFDLNETAVRLKDFIEQDQYFVFIARGCDNYPVGFATLCESYSLYAEGAFGTIPELYVRPEFRSKNIGHKLLQQVKTFANTKGWKRLEVTTPPLPEFDKTLAFYEREGFAISGGRKLKRAL